MSAHAAAPGVRSVVPGACWPAVPGPLASQLVALLWQLEDSQWYPPERLDEATTGQRQALLEHALREVPWYRQRYAEAGLDASRPQALLEAWSALPLLERSDLARQPQALRAHQVPPSHGPVATTRSTGSTGTPIEVTTTRLSRFFNAAVGLREHRWHQRDASAALAAIRPGAEAQAAAGRRAADWGPPVGEVYHTGPGLLAPSGWDTGRQLEWLAASDPAYLLTLPSLVAALVRASRVRGVALPGLREVRTYGEVVDPELRALVRDAWGCPLTDMYSAQETGYLALQCPDHPHYHVQSETVWLEVLDEAGRPCPPGTVGEVVVSVLHNFATPLIRYRIGDYAEVGAACACGRGLPVLTRVLGRRRNLATTPDGRHFWPSFPASVWQTGTPIRQLQLVQRSPQHIELHYVLERALDAAARSAIAERLRAALGGHRYAFSWHRRDAPIRRGASGKYEDFVNAIGDRP